MGHRIEIALVSFLFVFVGNVLSAPKERTTYFASDEHELIGNKIHFPREPGMNTTLTLPNGIQLTFGEIISLAGDFFTSNEPIIAVQGKEEKPDNVCKTESNKKPDNVIETENKEKPDRANETENNKEPNEIIPIENRKEPNEVITVKTENKKRPKEAFKTENKKNPNEVNTVKPENKKEPNDASKTGNNEEPNEVFKDETEDRKVTPEERKRFMAAYGTLAYVPRQKIQKEVAKLVRMIGEDLLVRKYKNGSIHTNAQYTLATNGRMLKLAATNFDHFQPQAPKAYLIGHLLALERAREAAKEENPDMKKQKLNEALSMDCFACHFLTDCFSSGHIRTPRVKLHFQIIFSGIGDLLSKYMHDEDCRFGLRVKNKRGDKWNAYGDGYLIKTGDEDNFQLVVEAANTSAYQVLEAYKNPDHEINSDTVMNLIPFVDPDAENNTPLFQIKDGKLHVRVDLDDMQSKKISPKWTGVGRVAKLAFYKPKNSALPPA